MARENKGELGLPARIPNTTLVPTQNRTGRVGNGETMTRRNRRFQRGSLYKRGKHKGVWVARWWEDVTAADGKVERVRRSENIGAVRDLPTRRDAERVLAERLRSINSSEYRPRPSCT